MGLRLFLISIFLFCISCRNLDSSIESKNSSSVSIELQEEALDRNGISLRSGEPNYILTKQDVYEIPNNNSYDLKVEIYNSRSSIYRQNVCKCILRTGIPYKVLVYNPSGNLVIEKDFNHDKNTRKYVGELLNGETYTFLIYANEKPQDPLPNIEGKEKLSTINSSIFLNRNHFFSVQKVTISKDKNYLNPCLIRGGSGRVIDLLVNTSSAGQLKNYPDIRIASSMFNSGTANVYTENKMIPPKALNFHEATTVENKDFTSGKVLILDSGSKYSLVIHSLETENNSVKIENFTVNNIDILPDEGSKIKLTLIPRKDKNVLTILALGSKPYVPAPGEYAINYFTRTITDLCTNEFSGVNLFFKSRENFNKILGERSKKYKKIEVVSGKNMEQGISTYNPDVIICASSSSSLSSENDRRSLKQFLEKGGRAILFLSDNACSAKVLTNVMDTKVNAYKTPNGYIRQLENVTHPILNGPFGDIKGKFVADDNTTSSLTWDIDNGQSIDILSKTKGNIFAFAHKNYNLVVVGEGGFLRGSSPISQSTDSNPFATLTDGTPVSKIHGASNVETYNSIFFGNALAWLFRNFNNS